MLRERTTGTLERLLTLPMAKLDLLVGYGLAFGAVAAVQATVVSVVGFGLLGLESGHAKLIVIVLAVANAILGMSLGLFLSAFARTEFQAVQFMPAFILPQILLCGLLVPREDMATWLEWLSALLPFTYAYDALARASGTAPLGARFWLDVGVVVGVTRSPWCSAPPRCAVARRDSPYADFTAEISLSTDSFASPNSIVVFGSR